VSVPARPLSPSCQQSHPDTDRGRGERVGMLLDFVEENCLLDNGKQAPGDWLLSWCAVPHRRWHFLGALHAKGRARQLASGSHSGSSVDGA
jgi:hypothetical protein